MIDPALVIRKITLISTDLKEIIKLSKKTQQEYLADPYSEVLAERYLERVIGRMIDINFHLITSHSCRNAIIGSTLVARRAGK